MFLKQTLLCLQKFHTDQPDLSPSTETLELFFPAKPLLKDVWGLLALVSRFSSLMFTMKSFAV